MSKFEIGDTCWFDDDRGTVLGVRPSEHGGASFDIWVSWQGGRLTWAWESDLLTEAEYHALCEEDD